MTTAYEKKIQAFHDAEAAKAKARKLERELAKLAAPVETALVEGEQAPISSPDAERQLAVPYSHAGMIQLIIDNPTWSHKQYAKHFGYTPGWFASVIASDNFQTLLDLRRDEVADPSLTATLEERFRALTLRSLTVLQTLLDNPKVDDATVIKAAEIGVKALGLGQKKSDEDDKPQVVHSLDTLADRLTSLLKHKGLGNAGIDHRTQQEIMIIDAMPTSDKMLHELKAQSNSDSADA